MPNTPAKSAIWRPLIPIHAALPSVEIEPVGNGFLVSPYGQGSLPRTVHATLDEALEAARSALTPPTKP